jgi:hypothetical protein
MAESSVEGVSADGAIAQIDHQIPTYTTPLTELAKRLASKQLNGF